MPTNPLCTASSYAVSPHPANGNIAKPTQSTAAAIFVINFFIYFVSRFRRVSDFFYSR